MENINFIDTMEIEIAVHGMTCQSCVKNITSKMVEKPGISEIKVSLEEEKATVKYDASIITSVSIVQNINDMGYTAELVPLAPNMVLDEVKVALLTIKASSDKSSIAEVAKKLTQQEGVISCDVYSNKELATVSYKPSGINPKEIETFMNKLGIGATLIDKGDKMLAAELAVTTIVHIEGMTCDSCTNSIKSALSKLTGIKSVEVSLKEKQAVIKHIPTKIMKEEVREAIDDIGFDATLLGEGIFS